jgi:exodeoxyribonuclease VIII
MIAPTVQRGMPFGDYCNLQAVNATLLMTYHDVSPAEARDVQIRGEKETTSLVKGHASHSAILEPEKFDREYAMVPAFGDYRVKENKDKKAKWLEEHGESIILDPDEYGAAINIRNSVMKDAFISTLFTGAGLNEATLLWTDADTGLDCKGRIDRLTTWHNYPVILDLKTTRSLDDREIQKAILNYGYHIRMAFYLDAMMLCKPGEYRVFLAWVLNRPPWIGRVTELDEDALEEGRAQYRKLLNLHAACVKADHWPGYTKSAADAPEVIGLPPWGYVLTSPKG